MILNQTAVSAVRNLVLLVDCETATKMPSGVYLKLEGFCVLAWFRNPSGHVKEDPAKSLMGRKSTTVQSTMALALGHGALPLRPASALGSNGFIGLGSQVGAFWMGVNGSIYLRVELGWV